MRKTLFLLTFIPLLCFLLSSETFRYKPPVTSLNELQGGWTCIHMDCEKICETCCENLVYLDFQIQGDSISLFKYPHQYFGTYKIETDSAKMSYDPTISKLIEKAFAFPLPNRYRSHQFSSLEFLNCHFPQEIRNDTLFSGDIYVRKKFDPKVITLLKKDSINPISLIGQWKIVTKYSNGYEGDELSDGFYHIELPFKVPSTLNFDTKTLAASRKGRLLKMAVNGMKKDFYIASVRENGFTIVPFA